MFVDLVCPCLFLVLKLCSNSFDFVPLVRSDAFS